MQVHNADHSSHYPFVLSKVWSYNLDSAFHYVPLSNHPILILWQCLVTFLNVLYEGRGDVLSQSRQGLKAETVKHLVILPCQHFEAVFLLITVKFNFTPSHSLFKDVFSREDKILTAIYTLQKLPITLSLKQM